MVQFTPGRLASGSKNLVFVTRFPLSSFFDLESTDAIVSWRVQGREVTVRAKVNTNELLGAIS